MLLLILKPKIFTLSKLIRYNWIVILCCWWWWWYWWVHIFQTWFVHWLRLLTTKTHQYTITTLILLLNSNRLSGSSLLECRVAIVRQCWLLVEWGGSVSVFDTCCSVRILIRVWSELIWFECYLQFSRLLIWYLFVILRDDCIVSDVVLILASELLALLVVVAHLFIIGIDGHHLPLRLDLPHISFKY